MESDLTNTIKVTSINPAVVPLKQTLVEISYS